VDLLQEISVYNILSRIPELGLQLLLFLTNPSQFAQDWLNSPKTRPSPGEVAAWSLGIFSTLYGLFRMARRLSSGERAASDPGTDVTRVTDSTERSKPRLLKIGFTTPILRRRDDGTQVREGESYSFFLRQGWEGVGTHNPGPLVQTGREFIFWPLPTFLFPELSIKGWEKPQLIIFRAGLVVVILDNLRADFIGSRKAQTVLTVLNGLVVGICLQPPAALLGARVSLPEAIDFAFVLFFFSIAVIAIVFYPMGSVIAILNRVFGVPDVSCLYIGVALVAVLVILARAFLLAFLTFYAFSFVQLFFAVLGGIALSVIVTPVLAIPSVLLLVKLKELIELFG
jgi:hypothetical protein